MAIHVIEVKNPFERKIDNQYYQTYVGGPVTDYVTHADCERVFAVNGIPVDETYIPDDGDEILVAPKVGKKAFRWILPATLVLVGAALGAGIIGGQMLIGWRIGLSLAATMIGNHMIEKMTKPAVDLTNTEQSNTYGWGTPSTLTGQGYVLPVLYGTVKTAGLMLQRHVVSDGDKQYLSILYCLAQGPIDSITDIKLNGNPLTNYQNCEIETRMGTNIQTVMKNFNDSYADTALAYELNNDSVWHTVQCDGNDAQGLEITLSFPQGLYHSNDQGNPDWTGVTIEAQYRKVGDTDWIKIPVWNENYTWEPPTGTSYHKRSWFSGDFGTELWWRKHWREDCGTFAGYKVDFTYTRHDRTYTVYKYDVDGNRIEKWTCSMSLADYKEKIISSHAGDGVIRQNKTEAFYRTYNVYNIPAGQYEVRVRCTHKDDTSTRTANKIQWVGITQIIYDDFRYPGKALLGLKALATDQLSGSDPQLTCLISRSLVWVWNPDTKAYEQKPAANPAWAAYDILHQCRKLTSVDGKDSFVATGISYENIDYDAFRAWAGMCDANNIDFNYLYDSAMKLYDALQYPCRVGYGAIVLIGTKVSCIYDCASDPVQLFTVANIKKDSFGNEYQSTDDRANCIEVSFMNKDKNYERDVLAVYADSYNESDTPQQPTQVELMGCTDVNQAYRYGAYKLRSNKYEIRTVSFEAFADAIACQIGDVILVQEDVTSWGLGGRIKVVDGNTITIDREAGSEGSDFTTLLVRNNSTDTLTYYKVSAVDGDKVMLTGTPSDIEADCIYALGYKGHEAKKFRVLSISTGHSDETRTIQAIEYYPELYDMDVTNLPEIERYDDTVEPPKNLILSTEKYCEADGTITNLVHATWINPRTLNPVVMEVSNDRENWTYEKKFVSGETQYTFTALSLQNYYVRLYAVNDVGIKSEYCANNILTNGTDTLPPDVKTINVEKMASGLRRYWWNFDYPYPNDIKGFRIKYTQGSELNWDAGIPVQEGLIVTQPYETQTVRQGTHAVMIKAVDNAGNESKNFAYCILDLGDLLEQNVLVENDFKTDTWEALTSNTGKIMQDGYIHAVNDVYMWPTATGYRWSRADDFAWKSNFKQYEVLTHMTAPASGQFWLEYDIDGPAIVYYRKALATPYWRKIDYNRPFWQKDSADSTAYPIGNDLWKQYSDRLYVNKGDWIEIRIVALNNTSQETVIKSLKAFIDVPDRNEHFEDLKVPAEGITLPIVTPNYKTVVCHLDAIQDSGTAVGLKILSRTPCVIQLIDVEGNAVSGVADISWQGYEDDT